MAQRGRNTQYPDHQIQDRELQEFTTRFTNSDGESVVVDADNPLPIVDTNYSVPSVVDMVAVDTGYVFIEPVAGKRIVITQMILYGDKGVSTSTEADVEIYESLTGAGTVVETCILKLGLLKQETAIIPFNVITDEGVWVMGKTSDDDVLVSIYYYYV